LYYFKDVILRVKGEDCEYKRVKFALPFSYKTARLAYNDYNM